MKKYGRTSHAQKRAARTHIPHTFQNGFRTHTHTCDRTSHVCVRARTFATHTLKNLGWKSLVSNWNLIYLNSKLPETIRKVYLPSGGVLDISLSKSPCRKAIGSSFQFQPSLSATIWRQIFTILAVMKKSLLASFASSMLHHFSLPSCSSEPKLFPKRL